MSAGPWLSLPSRTRIGMEAFSGVLLDGGLCMSAPATMQANIAHTRRVYETCIVAGMDFALSLCSVRQNGVFPGMIYFSDHRTLASSKHRLSCGLAVKNLGFSTNFTKGRVDLGGNSCPTCVSECWMDSGHALTVQLARSESHKRQCKSSGQRNAATTAILVSCAPRASECIFT